MYACTNPSLLRQSPTVYRKRSRMGIANSIWPTKMACSDSMGCMGRVSGILVCQSIPTNLDGSNVPGLGGAGHRVPAHHAHPLQRRGEVEPLKYLQPRVFSFTRYYCLALKIYLCQLLCAYIFTRFELYVHTLWAHRSGIRIWGFKYILLQIFIIDNVRGNK